MNQKTETPRLDAIVSLLIAQAECFELQAKATRRQISELLAAGHGEQSIYTLNLSVRAVKRLLRRGCYGIGDVVQKTEGELLYSRDLEGNEPRQFGITSLNEIKQKLGSIGLHLRGSGK